MASAGFVAEFSKKSPAVKLGAFLVIVLGLGGLYYQLHSLQFQETATPGAQAAAATKNA